MNFEDNSDKSGDETKKKHKSTSRVLTISSIFSKLMVETLATLVKTHNSLRIDKDVSERASILGVPIYPLKGD